MHTHVRSQLSQEIQGRVGTDSPTVDKQVGAYRGELHFPYTPTPTPPPRPAPPADKHPVTDLQASPERKEWHADIPSLLLFILVFLSIPPFPFPISLSVSRSLLHLSLSLSFFLLFHPSFLLQACLGKWINDRAGDLQRVAVLAVSFGQAAQAINGLCNGPACNRK